MADTDSVTVITRAPAALEPDEQPRHSSFRTMARLFWGLGRVLRFASPLRPGLLNLTLTAVAVVYLWIFSKDSDPELPFKGWQWVWPVVGTVVAVNLEVQLMLSLGGRRWRRRSLLGTVLVLFATLLISYHVSDGACLDPSVVIEHSDVELSWDVLSVIASSFDGRVLIGGVVVAIALLRIHRRWGLCFPEQPGATWRNALVLAAALGFVYRTPTVAYDEVSRVVQQLMPWRSQKQMQVSIPAGQFPLVHATPPASHASPQSNAKNVFVIFVESFNANVVEATAPNGRAYTPYFNSLIPKGLYVEKFYGNSVQTAKGHFASLCSLVPTSQREFVKFSRTRLHCLPKILQEAGFQTIFFQAHKSVKYDNTSRFLKRNGFELVETVANHQKDEDESSIWGWGLQDDVFYRRFFEYLDEVHPEADAKKPLFAMLAPISNHMPFNEVPESERKIYEDPSKPAEKFSNSVNVADRGLKAFFRELHRRKRFKDAIVIVTGDHSFPIDEHGFHHNETEAYEEFFRIPFLMLAPGRVEPERVRDTPYSQLDIAPTLLELTGVQPEKNHFHGISLLARPPQKHPIPLVQPYSGHFLAIVDYPYKYVLHLRDERARLFDLAADPAERHNLADMVEYEAVRARLHRLLRVHYVQEAALKQDQVWPPGE